jgi:hypothetical protein
MARVVPMRKMHEMPLAFVAGGGRLARRVLHRLSDESGIALVMAIGIMLVLTIALTTTIYFSSASARHASSSNAGQKAYALAEAGVNNAIAVLHASYDPPATPTFPTAPGPNPAYLPSGQAAYEGGSCSAPVNNCATWSGTIDGPLAGLPWHWQWTITATGTVQNPTGPGTTPVTRTATAVVPIVFPPTTPVSSDGPLNFFYSGSDMWFENSVHEKAPVYVMRDLHLESTAAIDGRGNDGAANKAAVGRDLYLKGPQNQIGLTGGTDPRMAEVHVVHQCSSKANPTLHDCGPSQAAWDTNKIYVEPGKADNVIPPGFLSYTPTLTPARMFLWYQNADLGPYSPCTIKTGSPPIFDTASGVPDNSVNLSATPTNAINLTPPGASYTCQSWAGSTLLGQLDWNSSTKLLTIKGTIFIDGSIYIAPGGTARYTGVATIIASGTFGMKGDTICATHPGYTGACDYTATSPWDPTKSALVIVANGAAGAGNGQGDGSDFNPGEGIEIKSADFQGALIANHTIRAETTSKVQGPMISIYDAVWAGQSNALIFPDILFAPSGGGGIITAPPPPILLDPRNFGGG